MNTEYPLNSGEYKQFVIETATYTESGYSVYFNGTIKPPFENLDEKGNLTNYIYYTD